MQQNAVTKAIATSTRCVCLIIIYDYSMRGQEGWNKTYPFAVKNN